MCRNFAGPENSGRNNNVVVSARPVVVKWGSTVFDLLDLINFTAPRVGYRAAIVFFHLPSFAMIFASLQLMPTFLRSDVKTLRFPAFGVLEGSSQGTV